VEYALHSTGTAEKQETSMGGRFGKHGDAKRKGAPYNDDTPENGLLRSQNTYFWNASV